ncbi:MAG: crotonase/enoyl-CoA hydratase family protein [Actinomycetota bacterium]|nr:crotonase/enoyl-CoA hydratase family protein [Actinomycetota bacterium]
MGEAVSYELGDGIASISMDDGKVNALSLGMLAELDAALDQAGDDGAAVVITGRSGVFSAGFDLKVLRSGGEAARTMLRQGFELAERLLCFPAPVVVACSGHALAMASFLLLSADYRIGADGPFKIGPNEVAIGMVMPLTGVELCRQRLTPAHFNRAVANAEIYGPAGALEAGFLDRVVPAGDLAGTALEVAGALAALDRQAHAATKLRVRDQALAAIRAAIAADDAAMAASS